MRNVTGLRPAIKGATAACSALLVAGLGLLFYGPEAAISRIPAAVLMALAAAALAGLVYLQATARKAPAQPAARGPAATVIFAVLVVIALALLFFVGAYDLR